MPRYLLSEHSFVCTNGDHAVFLDLRQDKYTAVEPDDVRLLRTVVQGWPPAESPSSDTPESPITPGVNQHGVAITQMLLEEGLLTTDEKRGKKANRLAVERVTTTIDHVQGSFPRIDFKDVRNFVRAWAQTTLMLRLCPLERLVRRVERRKTQRLSTPHSHTDYDVQKLHRLMVAYFVLRPNFFSEKDACLRDSLTFIEFLASYGLYPTWVFGVTMKPFSAHAWVQNGPMVLNDYIPHVTRFTPIMAI